MLKNGPCPKRLHSLLRKVNTKAIHEYETMYVLRIVKERLMMPWTHMTLTHLTSKVAITHLTSSTSKMASSKNDFCMSRHEWQSVQFQRNGIHKSPVSRIECASGFSFLLFLHVCMCISVCTRMHMPLGVRGQPVRSCPPCVLRQGLSLAWAGRFC